MASPASRLLQPPPAQSQMPPAPGEFVRPPTPKGKSPWRIQGFSRNSKGIAGFGDLDEFYAKQNRDVPAFYDPTNPTQIPSASQMAGNAQAMGQQINPDGTTQNMRRPFSPMGQQSSVLTPPPVAPAPAVAPWGGNNSLTPTAGVGGVTINPPIGGGALVPPSTAPALQQPQSPLNSMPPPVSSVDTSFQDRLANARAAVDAARAQQQARPPITGNDTMVTPYGTASSSTAPRTGPGTTNNGLTTLPEFFQASANRQGVGNKFAQPNPNDPLARTWAVAGSRPSKPNRA
jgi:hypothetical protein